MKFDDSLNELDIEENACLGVSIATTEQKNNVINEFNAHSNCSLMKRNILSRSEKLSNKGPRQISPQRKSINMQEVENFNL